MDRPILQRVPLIHWTDDPPEIEGVAIELVDEPAALTDKQVTALAMMSRNPLARHVCLVGGARSGKTVALLFAICFRAHRAPSRHVVLRFRANSTWTSIGAQTLPWVLATFFPLTEIIVHRSDQMFELPEYGSQIYLGGLDDKERAEKILGHEYHSIMLNEASQIPYASVVQAQTRLAQIVRGSKQRVFIDLNPGPKGHWTNQLFGEHRDPINRGPVSKPDDYIRMFMNPLDNLKHLQQDPGYLRTLENLPGKAKQRFWHGVYQDESADSFWSVAKIEETRIAPGQLPELTRVVVAVDPSGAKNDLDFTHDAIGIVVVALGRDGHAYVLNDATMLGSPEAWATEAVRQYRFYGCDALIAETNYGGAMVAATIRAIDRSVNFIEASATRGKELRAAPVAALYAQRMVHHVGNFPELEDEMYACTDMGYQGERSPNRLDSMVYAVSNLLLTDREDGYVQMCAAALEKVNERKNMARSFKSEVVPSILPTTHQNPWGTFLSTVGKFISPATPPPPPAFIHLQAPAPFFEAYVSVDDEYVGAFPDGHTQKVVADDRGLVTVEPQFVKSACKTGCYVVGHSVQPRAPSQPQAIVQYRARSAGAIHYRGPDGTTLTTYATPAPDYLCEAPEDHAEALLQAGCSRAG